MTLRFDGLTVSTITVTDGMGVIFSDVLNPGAAFTITGSVASNKFVGANIAVSINGVPNATIMIICGTSAPLVGDVYGSFSVIAGKSKSGGAICCRSDFMETEPPIFTNCPIDIIKGTSSPSCTSTVSWIPPTAADNCGLANISSNYVPGDVFPFGITTVQYTALDNFGNTAICSFKVTVINENTPGISGCSQTIQATADEQGIANVTWEEPVGSTTCGELIMTKSHEPGSDFPVGTTTVTYSFSNGSGSIATCAFDVVVSERELKVEIGKAITPDGDGINDTWIISNIDQFTNNMVVVVDRWGNEIYSVSGYNNNNVVWAGKNKNGQLVPTGTYFFSIRIEDSTGFTIYKKGFIEVVR